MAFAVLVTQFSRFRHPLFILVDYKCPDFLSCLGTVPQLALPDNMIRPARLSACIRPRSAWFFILVRRPVSRFTLPVRSPLDIQEHITFSAVCQVESSLFQSVPESKRHHSLDTTDYSTFETVCQELFSWPENFVLSGRSSLLHRAAMPCPYWFRLCAPLTDVSVRPVTQKCHEFSFDGFQSVLCRFRRLRPVNAVRRSVVPPSFHRLSA